METAIDTPSPADTAQGSLEHQDASGAMPVSSQAEPAEQKAAVPPPAPVVAAQMAGRPAEDRYDFGRCTILLVVQLRPQAEAGHPRQVVLSVQNGLDNTEDFPLYRLLTEEELGGPFPPAVETLLEELRQDLPTRKLRHAARPAVPPPSPPAPKIHAAHTRSGKPAASPAPAAPALPPPVPTTSTPIPKAGLVMGGLFDEA